MSLMNSIKICLFALVLSLVFTSEGRSESLSDAFVRAYHSNPSLMAARHDYERVLYFVPEAQSGYRPQLNASASQVWSHDKNDINGSIPGFYTDTELSSQNYNLTIVQALFRGGRTQAAVESAKALVKAQSYALLQAEQELFLSVAEAYLGLKEQISIEKLREKNVIVLDEQRLATQDKFDAGLLTKTDVTQAESRLSQAQAALILARSETNKARALYEKVIGFSGASLDEGAFDVMNVDDLPKTIGFVLQKSERDHPRIAQALALKAAAIHDVDGVFGELLPELKAVGSVSRSYDPSLNVSQSDNASISFDLSIPLYQGGATRARIASQQRLVLQREDEVHEVRKQIRLEAISAWNDFVARKSQIEALEKQVVSAKMALDGVVAEAQVGGRTVLDVLDAEEEKLEAQVSLVSAVASYQMSWFSLLAVLGDLTASGLQLSVDGYGFQQKYDDVNGDWMLFK